MSMLASVQPQDNISQLIEVWAFQAIPCGHILHLGVVIIIKNYYIWTIIYFPQIIRMFLL